MRERERWLILVCQVGLMTALPEVRAAMRVHAGVAAVVEHATWFLWSLTYAEENKVRVLVAAYYVLKLLMLRWYPQ